MIQPDLEIRVLTNELGTESTDAALAGVLDERDPLLSFRSRFHLPPREDDSSRACLYFCGNSLGLQPKTARKYVLEDLDKWAEFGVEGHFVAPRPWVSIESTVQDHLVRILGARFQHEVAAMGSLTNNVHILMMNFYRPTAKRFKILIEGKSFPSDRYAVESQVRMHGFNPSEAIIELKPREGEVLHRTSDILKEIEQHGDEIALVWLGAVQYYTGQAFEIPRIAIAAQQKGCKFGLDLAHAAGNIELKLHEWGVDCAAFCSYKYLNSGPGGMAGIFVHNRHADERPMLAGWWGHQPDTRFRMGHEFIAQRGALGYQLSNPAVMPMSLLLASLEIFTEAGIGALRDKSIMLTGYLQHLLDELIPDDVASIITPREIEERGAQLSLLFPAGVSEIHAWLQRNGAICDKRDPDVLRVAPAPLYNSFSDVHAFVTLLKRGITELKTYNKKQ